MDAISATVPGRASAGLEFLHELACYLHPPGTDLVDAVAVWLGDRPIAALFLQGKALAWPAFGRLTSRAYASGLFMADLNGNLGVSSEYEPTLKGSHVPIWLLCRSPATLAEVVDHHRLLQPQGFAFWSKYLGDLLGYPGCCVEAYIRHVDSPSAIDAYWRQVQSRSSEEIFVNFAPCKPHCRAALENLLVRLKCARKANLLDIDAMRPWFMRHGFQRELAETESCDPTIDLSTFGCRIPARAEARCDRGVQRMIS